jgi:hypothetical protein
MRDIMHQILVILYICLIVAFIIAVVGGLAFWLYLDGRLGPMLLAFALVLPLVFGLEYIIKKLKSLFKKP